MNQQAAPQYPIIVFADGACSGNPGPGGWGVIIATPDGQVLELGGFEASTTNNQMELTAVIRALDRIRDLPLPVAIHTDSVYVIRGITQWVWGWRNKNWKTAEGSDVANQELWKRLIALVAQRKSQGSSIDWRYVRGHSGIPGNERCDEIAVAYSQRRSPHLYAGPLLSYSVAIHDLPDKFDLPEFSTRKNTSTPAYSYLSVIGNIPMRHKTWAECERRVKGHSGAKFKKALTSQEEEQILEAWGYSLKDIPAE